MGTSIVPFYAQNKVAEFDTNGWKLWEVSANRPTGVMRLPNGNTLVTSRLSHSIEEIDRKGKEVWRYESGNTGSNYTFSARRR